MTADRNGRPFTVTSSEAEVAMKGSELDHARFLRDVKMKSNDLEVAADEATYSEAEGVVKIPGAVTFSRARMKGSGIGATYDRNREVLWLLDQAKIAVAPDKSGQGALDASSKSAGLARQENYIRLTGTAHINADGRLIDADEITIALTPATSQQPDQHVRSLELRGNSRIAGGGGANAPQAMSARDIGLTYAEDGRTLQHANLLENAVVQLPGDPKGAGRRIAGKTIVIDLAPDGATVTALTANENVQVDLPADGDLAREADPLRIARRHRCARRGPAERHLYGERRVPGDSRRACQRAGGRSDCAFTVARRRNQAWFRRGAASGLPRQRALHGRSAGCRGCIAGALSCRPRSDRSIAVPRNRVPSRPACQDGRVTVEARTIQILARDAQAQSRHESPQFDACPAETCGPTAPVAPLGGRGKPAPAGRAGTTAAAARPQPTGRGNADGTHVPASLEAGSARDRHIQPADLRWRRRPRDLQRQRAAVAVGHTKFMATPIIVDDKPGNLEAQDNVRTEMMLDDVDPKTKSELRRASIGEGDAFVYDDAKRLATYTGKAHMIGSEGDRHGRETRALSEPDTNELERAEGYGANGDGHREGKRTRRNRGPPHLHREGPKPT